MGHIDDQYCETGDTAVSMITPLLERMSYKGYVDTVETGSRLAIPLQRAGVDLMVWLSPGEVYCVEVKGEKRHSPNIFVEETTCNGKLGWVHTLRSDILIYVFISTSVAHLLKLEPFLSWYGVYGELYKRKNAISFRGAVSTGTIIPWTHIEAELLCNQYQTFNLNEPGTWDTKLNVMGLLPGGDRKYQLNCNNGASIGRNSIHGCSSN